jgi:hypothetical protein
MFFLAIGWIAGINVKLAGQLAALTAMIMLLLVLAAAVYGAAVQLHVRSPKYFSLNGIAPIAGFVVLATGSAIYPTETNYFHRVLIYLI